MLEKQLLDILACPECKGDLEYQHGEGVSERLICHHCRLAFFVHDNIPVMLLDQAQRLGDDPSPTGEAPPQTAG
jgi:uncharacterized protein YbaR (Trm112 family)